MSLLSPTHVLVTTGPESCGKSTLAQALGAALDVPVVGEAARDFLDERLRREGHCRYEEHDLLAIAQLQLAREQAALAARPARLVCDTDLLVILVWSEVRFGRVDPQLRKWFTAALAAQPRTYLLCDHRVPWVPDPQREDPDNRPALFEHYRRTLDELQLDYAISSGSVAERVQQATLLLQPACPCCRD